MSQIIVCLKKYAKDSRMVYYFRLELEVQIDAHANCAFTPDVTCVNKSRYSRVVGRLNILSLLASFAREIHFTTDVNSRHGRGFCHCKQCW